MAKYKFLSEKAQDEDNHIYVVEVLCDLGGDEPQRSEHEMVLNPEEAHDKAKEFADALEAKLQEKNNKD